MSTVDWWKSAGNKNLIGFLPSGVRWIFLRSFGKARGFPTGDATAQIYQQTFRMMLTISPHVFWVAISPQSSFQ
jgi:hypothetical protein